MVTLKVDAVGTGIIAALVVFVVLWQDLHHRLPDDGHSMRQRHTELIDNTFVPTGLARDAADLLGVNLTTAVQAMPTQPATPAPVAPLETIFVSIAAYRDNECASTLNSLYKNATHPERVHVGVCQQLKLAEESCLPPSVPWSDEVSLITVPFFQAKGPCYARHLVTTLYKNEDFFMQLDSHSVLIEGWDVAAVDMWKRCPHEKCVLSHYPLVDGSSAGVPVICNVTNMESHGLPAFQAIIYGLQQGQFMPTPIAGAGFIMARGEVLLDVPYDPHLDMLFVGEEILHSARLYTHGYNLYAPDMNLVFHHYNRREKPSMFTDLKEAWHRPQQKSADRAKYLLGVADITKPQDEGEHSLEYYGMGTARSVQDYLAYAAIDLNAKTHTTDQKFCRPPPLELPVAAGTTESDVN